ncbi:MAG: hypothetical protein ACRDLL_03020 [Solirubrobacterales bacterium]
MSRQAGVRCPNCGHLIPPGSIWAINRTCSECLQPCGLTGEQTDLGGDGAGADGEASSSSFWALENFAEGMIAAAHHYLTNPKILEEAACNCERRVARAPTDVSEGMSGEG